MMPGLRHWRALRPRHRFVSFLLVGALNTLFGYSVYAAVIYLGGGYRLAVALSTIIGALFNFKSTGLLVFDHSDSRLILRFLLVYGVVFLVNLGGVGALVSSGFGAYLAGFLMLPILALLAYLLNSRYVFNQIKTGASQGASDV
jgi:putative flippase GtrA